VQRVLNGITGIMGWLINYYTFEHETASLNVKITKGEEIAKSSALWVM
jgi:hypothetical protein